MPPQRSTEFVALMAKLHPRATTSAALMPQKTSQNSGGWWRSTPLSIASLPRSTRMISTVRASSLLRKCSRNRQVSHAKCNPENHRFSPPEIILVEVPTHHLFCIMAIFGPSGIISKPTPAVFSEPAIFDCHITKLLVIATVLETLK